jgi:hypothetical protein
MSFIKKKLFFYIISFAPMNGARTFGQSDIPSTCHFVYLPVFLMLYAVQFCWLTIMSNLPLCQHAILSACHSVSMPFCQHAILSACHSVSMPFCQHAILSACHSVSGHFVNLPFCLWPFCQLTILSTYHFVNLPFCQHTILSTCHFVNLPFCQLAIL